MTPEQVKQLLAGDESDRLERKASLSDSDGIRDTLIQFANDLAGRGGGHLIIGQAPDKSIVGLRVSDDEAQQKIAGIARDKCRPAIPIKVECHETGTGRVAIVDVRASAARPHFTGNCYVRAGSTKRSATDAEIMVLRHLGADPKLAVVQKWLADGKTLIRAVQRPDARHSSAYESDARLLEVHETYIVLQFSNSTPVTLALSAFEPGWDFAKKRPQITYAIGTIV